MRYAQGVSPHKLLRPKSTGRTRPYDTTKTYPDPKSGEVKSLDAVGGENYYRYTKRFTRLPELGHLRAPSHDPLPKNKKEERN